MTELIKDLILNQRKYCIPTIAEKLEGIVTLAGQIKDCTSFDILRDLLEEISNDARYIAEDIEKTFNLDD